MFFSCTSRGALKPFLLPPHRFANNPSCTALSHQEAHERARHRGGFHLTGHGKKAKKTPGKTVSKRFTLLGRDERKLRDFAAFSPAIAHWELATNKELARGEALKPQCWSFDTALLFVDISGFTNLCTRLEVDALQRHINNYFTALIDVVVAHGGDVLRFAGDAVVCSWYDHEHYRWAELAWGALPLGMAASLDATPLVALQRWHTPFTPSPPPSDTHFKHTQSLAGPSGCTPRRRLGGTLRRRGSGSLPCWAAGPTTRVRRTRAPPLTLGPFRP